MIIYFDKSCIERLQTKTTIQAQLAAIQAIIDTLLGAAAAAALNADVQEYSFDNGQTKTKMVYKDVSAITGMIKNLMALQQLYLQMPGMNNRVVRLIDANNFRSWFNCYP